MPNLQTTPTINLTEVALDKYPRMEQRYFLKNEDGSPLEIFRLKTSVTVVAGDKVYTIVTSTGKVHKFAVHVNAVDPNAAKLAKAIESACNLAFKRYMAHEIDMVDFNLEVERVTKEVTANFAK